MREKLTTKPRSRKSGQKKKMIVLAVQVITYVYLLYLSCKNVVSPVFIMPKATRYPCSNCGNSFVLEFFVQQNRELCCLICDSQSASQAEIKELRQEVALLKDELRRLSQVNKAAESIGERQENASTVKNSSGDGFTVVRSGRKASAHSMEGATVPLQNRFAPLQEEAEPEPDVMLVGDSLVRGQGSEFCWKKRSRKFRCYPGQKIEDITERVDFLVENSTDDTMFVTVVGTNNLRCDTAPDIVDKYRVMIREFATRRRKVAVCGIIPRYDVGPAMFRKMSIVNRKVKALCSQEGMHFFDLWHHFCLDKSLYVRDGIHLSSVGKARLGRVIGECLADISRPPVAGNGSTNDEVTASVADEVTVDSVAGNSYTAPDTESETRQEEGVAAVPVSIPEPSTRQDF